MEYSEICPAKINLILNIHKKRPDGFHNIGTLFQKVQFGDILTARSHSSLKLNCDKNITVDPNDNLVIRAASILRKHLKISKGIAFSLQKKLPDGAGLGGGSSDAAAALRLCLKIWGMRLPLNQLIPIAKRIGADVPFFLMGPTCFATGIGDQLEPAPSLSKFQVLIATPHCSVNTAKAYQLIQPRLNDTAYSNFRRQYLRNPTSHEVLLNMSNDFESPILAKFPEIHTLYQAISKFDPNKLMLSGSGSSLFALFSKTTRALACQEKIKDYCRFNLLTRFATENKFPV